jgi:hypothetical protein
LDTGGVNNNGGFSIDGALVFTNTTAGALFFLDDGALLLVTHDRLIGTLFVANEADLLSIPGNASGLVNMSDTHLDEAFFFNGERSDRFCGANSSAEIAELFTVADPGDKPRCIKTCQACF